MVDHSNSQPSTGSEGVTKKTLSCPNRGGFKSLCSCKAGSIILFITLGIFLLIGGFVFFSGGPHTLQKQDSEAVAVDRAALSSDQSRDEGQSESAEAYQEEGAESLSDDPEACLGCMSQMSSILPSRPDESQLRVPGAKEIHGRWVASLPDAMAELVLDGIHFQIVYDAGFEEGIRRYVRGYYAYDMDTGAVTLNPAYKDPAPSGDSQNVYLVLTARVFDVYVKTDEKASFQYWTAPPEMLASRQIFPLLGFTGIQDNPYLVWQRVE